MSSRQMIVNASLAAICLSISLAEAKGGVVAMDPVTNPTYTVNFNSAADVADFTAGLASGTGVTDSWSIGGSQWQHQLVSPYAVSIASSQLLQTSGVAGKSFTVSTDVTLSARDTSQAGWNISLPVLARDGDFDIWGGQSWYQVTLRMGGSGSASDSLAITSSDIDWVNYAPTVLASQDLASRMTTGEAYHLTVTGTYDSSGNLTLGAVLQDGGTEIANIQSASLASPKADGVFGYAESIGWGSSGTANYSNFTLSVAAVPEPASLSLLGLTALGLLARRRKQV